MSELALVSRHGGVTGLHVKKQYVCAAGCFFFFFFNEKPCKELCLQRGPLEQLVSSVRVSACKTLGESV